jgi:hypothetical protein
MLPQLMNTETLRLYKSRVARFLILGCAVVVFAAVRATGQGQIIPAQKPSIITPQPQSTPTQPNRQHVATLRSTDSSAGSRLALTSDQSLRDYEAYRRGDRFYVRIPAADIGRLETVRGKAFTDVQAQRTGDTTLVSLQLQPGATAHVEQQSNRLDIVIALPGATGTSEPPGINPSATSASSTLPNVSNRRNRLIARAPQNVLPSVTPKPTPIAGASARPSPTASQTTSATPKAVPATSPVAVNQSTNPNQTQPNQNGWARFKERVHYWILLAQLNPIPISLGVAILLLLMGLLFYWRRADDHGETVEESKPKSEAPIDAIPSAPSPGPLVPSAGEKVSSVATTEPIANGAVAASTRQVLIDRVAVEAKKVLAGDDYDRAVIGSTDAVTRKLVAAELLAALVGKNADRRQRARAAFMDHGYFDDATRDLRIAESSNERAAAARRLSFVRNREATPHLIGALSDSSPDVRRAAVEALMDLRDPGAIPSLNSLMQTEADQRVPRNLIKQAIDACATSTVSEKSIHQQVAGPVIAESTSRPNIEREVFEL